MLRNRISLAILVAAVSLMAQGIASAQCSTCNSSGHLFQSGCLTGHCNDGGCNYGGGCLKCETIWDDYCANKSQCLPEAHYPFQNRKFGLCGGCGQCSSCDKSGVGIYNQCAPKHIAGLFSKLFKHKKHALAGCDTACSDSCDVGCADATVVGEDAPPAQPAAPVETPPAPAASARFMPHTPLPPMPVSRSSSSGTLGWLQDALRRN